MGHISKLEASQRYFFAAASQEFKTPIASINAILDIDGTYYKIILSIGNNGKRSRRSIECSGHSN